MAKKSTLNPAAKTSKCRILVHTNVSGPAKTFPFTRNGMRKAAAIANGVARSGGKSGRSISAFVSVRCYDTAYGSKNGNWDSIPLLHCSESRCTAGQGSAGKAHDRYLAKHDRAGKSANRPLAGANRRRK